MDQDAWSTQSGYGVRFEWGPTGAGRLAGAVAALVVVDVLSFTTTVSVAVERGIRVYPYPWKDDGVREFAARHGAEPAVGRREVSDRSPWSLSPAALRVAPFTPRLVLPSPNGSAIAAAAAERVPVYAACLRNATAVARHLRAEGYGTPARPVAVIAAGERWPDGSLRPAVEDLLGAGAVIAALPAAHRSPEAAFAAATAGVSATSTGLAAAVAASASGRELTDGGWPQDVAVAVEADASTVVPVLTDGAFTGIVGPPASWDPPTTDAAEGATDGATTALAPVVGPR
ncbi:2-phosphosulfolactate phosphatase [Kitasatospora sp. NPDC096147]|uniref:2-phosphosulfolactate phosphatase n=1 Tax=Kitasatospora sp. NPDC096147 TaxID=3364093 RepID=UPI0038082ABE